MTRCQSEVSIAHRRASTQARIHSGFVTQVQISREVQNRGIIGHTKKTDVLQKIKKKKLIDLNFMNVLKSLIEKGFYFHSLMLLSHFNLISLLIALQTAGVDASFLKQLKKDCQMLMRPI